MRNAVNWTLIACGGILIVAELLLGAAAGLDLALMGLSLVAGGGIGLFFGSTKVGLFFSGALAFAYFAFFRRSLRSRWAAPGRLSNVDALVGRTGVVTARIARDTPGMVKVGDEVWRAALASTAGAAREPGQAVTVESVEGVTLLVR